MAREEDDCLGESRGDEEWMSMRGNAWVPRWEDDCDREMGVYMVEAHNDVKSEYATIDKIYGLLLLTVLRY